MKTALVIHPVLSYLAGGELLCLHVCKALQEMDYRVILVSNEFDPEGAERIYGLGRVMKACTWITIPKFKPVIPRLIVLEELFYAVNTWSLLKSVKADVAFSTQSSSFALNAHKIFHFVYDIRDLYSYPSQLGPNIPRTSRRRVKNLYLSAVAMLRRILWMARIRSPTAFLAVGSEVLADLKKQGYHNSFLVFPPSRSFKPVLSKKRQVFQAARLLPEKRLELYFEIASLLPEYSFYLLGRRLSTQEGGLPDYQRNLLSGIPKNVVYLEGVMKDHAQLLEQSMVYVHTGKEKGVVMTVAEAMSAGCFPLSPVCTGGADIIQAAGVGFLYGTARDAATKIREVLESKYSKETACLVAEKAGLFGVDAFERKIKTITLSQ